MGPPWPHHENKPLFGEATGTLQELPRPPVGRRTEPAKTGKQPGQGGLWEGTLW
jgi:hypothetical protein